MTNASKPADLRHPPLIFSVVGPPSRLQVNDRQAKIKADGAAGDELNPGEVTALIEAAANGRQDASDQLMPLVYDELRRLAHARMQREKPGQTLQATALVHEAYLRLVGSNTDWENRRHFFAAAAETMRRIMIERARHYAAVKHGGELRRTGFEQLELPDASSVEQLVEWDQLIDQLANNDEAMANVVKLRFFAGFSVQETAHALELSSRTVNRHWTGAQAWLRLQLERGAQ